MTKEELIERLQRLSDILPQNQNDLDIMSLELDKKELDDRLGDVENYRSADAAATNRAENQLRREELTNARSQLRRANTKLDSLNRQLEAANQNVQRVSDEETVEKARLNQAILSDQRRLQLNANLDQDEINNINANIASLQSQIAASDARVATANQEVANLESEIAAQQQVITNAEAVVSASQARVDAFKDVIREEENFTTFARTTADHVARMEDQAQSENIERSINSIGENGYSRINLRRTIDSLVEGLQNDTITFEQAQQVLKDYSDRNITREVTNASDEQQFAEIEATDVAIARARAEIQRLERRLSDDENYRNSAVADTNIGKIRRAEINYRNHENNEARIQNEIAGIDDRIDQHNQEITDLRATIDFLTQDNAARELAITALDGQNLSDAFKAARKASIEATINANNQEIARIENEIIDRNNKITDLQTEKGNKTADLQKEQDFMVRYDGVIDGLKQSYEFDQNTNQVSNIDTVVKGADERRLQQVKASLVNLEKYRSFLSYDMKGQINEIVNAQNTSITQQQTTGQAQQTTGTQTTGQNQQTTGAQTTGQNQQATGQNQQTTGTQTTGQNQQTTGTQTTGQNQQTNGTATVTSTRKANPGLIAKGKAALAKLRDKLKSNKAGFKALWYATCAAVVAGGIFVGTKLFGGKEKEDNNQPQTTVEQQTPTPVSEEDNLEKDLDDALANTASTDTLFTADDAGFKEAENNGNDYVVDASSAYDMMSDEELGKMVIHGDFGNGQARKDALGDNYSRAQSWVDKNWHPVIPTQQATATVNTAVNPTAPEAHVGDTYVVKNPAPGIISEKHEVIATTPQGSIPTTGEVHEQTPDPSIQPGENISGGELISSTTTPVTGDEGKENNQGSNENGNNQGSNENGNNQGSNGNEQNQEGNSITTQIDENTTVTISGGGLIGSESSELGENENILELYPGDSYQAADGQIVTNTTDQVMKIDITKYNSPSGLEATDISDLAEQWQASMSKTK